MSAVSPVTVTRIPRPDEPVGSLSLLGAAVFAAGNEAAYVDNDPALSDVRGRPITADEYRRLRELAG